jgi:hypothetical protein
MGGVEKFAGVIALGVILYYVFHPNTGQGDANNIISGLSSFNTQFVGSLQGGYRFFPVDRSVDGPNPRIGGR